MTLNIKIPDKLKSLYTSVKRYILVFGGRGSAKSWGIAIFLVITAYKRKVRILCTREIQNSIKDSVHKLLCDIIEKLNLSSFYKITERSIVGANGSEFIFKGLRNNVNDIKSTEGIDYCWVEEAHTISRKSLEILTPTIRKEGSQLIFAYNPTDETDPIHADYNLADREDVERIEINYSDNPFFPEVLRAEMEYDKRVDYEKYLHKWMGQCVKHSEAQVFYGKWFVEEFEAPENVWFYFGADWGFSKDPTTLGRNFVIDKTLYIDYEFYEIGVDIDLLPNKFKTIPESQNYPIIADNARPETISYMQRNGFPKMRACKKGAGSIEDGIAHLRSYERIVVHPRCKHHIDEFRLYSYVVDPKTGQISNKIEDKHNHCIDQIRYSQEDVMRHNKGAVIQTGGW
jgi:phage terminase large subunit